MDILSGLTYQVSAKLKYALFIILKNKNISGNNTIYSLRKKKLKKKLEYALFSKYKNISGYKIRDNTIYSLRKKKLVKLFVLGAGLSRYRRNISLFMKS